MTEAKRPANGNYWNRKLKAEGLGVIQPSKKRLTRGGWTKKRGGKRGRKKQGDG